MSVDLGRKMDVIYQILLASYSCAGGHGIQHHLCDSTCYCLCKPWLDAHQKKECEKPRNYPLGDFDAKHWAEEFCRVTGFKDEDWAHSWFASAIMTGYDAYPQRNKPAPEPEKCVCGHSKEYHQPRTIEPDLGRVVCGVCQCGRYHLPSTPEPFYGKSAPEMMADIRDEAIEQKIHQVMQEFKGSEISPVRKIAMLRELVRLAKGD